MAEIVFENKYNFETPAGLNIYRLRRPGITEDTLRRVAARFGLRATAEAGTLLLDPSGIAYSEASGWGLKQLRQSGGWQYRHAERWQAPGTGHLHIDDQEAGRLALDAIRQYGLPTHPELEQSRVERLHVAHAERGGANHEERIVGVRVLFRRIVDGLPVEGPAVGLSCISTTSASSPASTTCGGTSNPSTSRSAACAPSRKPSKRCAAATARAPAASK